MDINVLLIGFGKIAKIHAKYLNKKNIPWSWYDPYIQNKDCINYLDNRIMNLEKSIKNYNRVMILTPENTHFRTYKFVRNLGYSGWIFVEKPAIMYADELEIFEDNKIIVGMVERFNPTIESLIKYMSIDKIINIDFSRCSVSEHSTNITTIEDLGIHDIDLYYYITNFKKTKNFKYDLITKENTTFLTIEDDIITRFVWSKDTYFKERKIIVRQTDCTFELDLQEQSLKKFYYYKNKIVCESLYVEKSSPIEREQENFFLKEPEYVDTVFPHKFLINILER